MSSGDWEEVKRLAADFQRAQLTSAAQRLTDRNCVEIINKLLELKLLDVVFTTDGKEYVTPQHISREILDELFVHGGRLSLSDLASNLNVSLNVITARVVELVKTEKHCHFVLGQLLTSEYLDALAYDLNEKLSQDGVLSLNDVSKNVDLPGDFLHEQLLRRLGKIIKGRQDETDVGVIYTEAFVRRNTARVRGILSAITRPTPVNQILGKFQQLPDKLFFQILHKLLTLKRVDGILSGSSRSAYYIPSIYSKAQVNYIEGFMKGNGYIDLEVAARLGITDPKSFVQKRFPNEELTFLKTCCLGETLFKQVKETVEESLASPGWVDVSLLLPFSVTEKDVELLLELMINPNCFIFGSTIVNKSLVQNVQTKFKPLMEEKALKDIESGRYIQLIGEIRANEKKSKASELNAAEYDSRSHKKDDRRKKAAGGKGGGGTQGRETKTKSTKKKYMAGKRDESSESEEEIRPTRQAEVKGPSKTQLPFLSNKEIQTILKKEDTLKEGQEDLLNAITSKLLKPLTDEYQTVLKATYDIFITEKCGRKSKEELLRTTKEHLNTLKLYADGLNEFEGDVKTQLEKFLTRTFGQEVINAITQFLLVEAGLEADGKVTDLPADMSNSLYQLGKAQSPAQLLQDIELQFQLKTDKNLDATLTVSRETLQGQLVSAQESKDPALFLHIFILLAFSLKTQKLLQASGKFVPQILAALQSKLVPEDYLKIKSYQEAVVKHIRSKSAAGDEIGALYDDLNTMLKTFKS